MGGPGLLGIVGHAKTLPKVDVPLGKKILVDIGAFHQLLLRASYNKSPQYDAVAFIKNSLLRKFHGLDVEFFFDGDGMLKSTSLPCIAVIDTCNSTPLKLKSR